MKIDKNTAIKLKSFLGTLNPEKNILGCITTPK